MHVTSSNSPAMFVVLDKGKCHPPDLASIFPVLQATTEYSVLLCNRTHTDPVNVNFRIL